MSRDQFFRDGDRYGRGGGMGRERSPGRGGYERGVMDMFAMGSQMGFGMDDMWRTMYEGMRQVHPRCIACPCLHVAIAVDLYGSHARASACICVGVCVRARVRACVHVCVSVRVYAHKECKHACIDAPIHTDL